jgi:anti-sigma B factor antagonist
VTVETYGLGFDRDGHVAIAALSGEVDMSNAAIVRQRIAEAVTPDDVALVLDVAALSFIDSAGLHAIFELGSVLAEKRQRLLLSVPETSHVRRTIEIIGMPGAIVVHPDRDAALADARSTPSESRPVAPGGDG